MGEIDICFNITRPLFDADMFDWCVVQVVFSIQTKTLKLVTFFVVIRMTNLWNKRVLPKLNFLDRS